MHSKARNRETDVPKAPGAYAPGAFLCVQPEWGLTYIEYRYIIIIAIFDIKEAGHMARKKLDTLTEQMYYVLLALRQERHGYGVMQYIAQLTDGRVNVGAGTLYALLDRFEKDGLIDRTRTEEARKYYCLTPEGEHALHQEYERLRRQAEDMERALREEEGL